MYYRNGEGEINNMNTELYQEMYAILCGAADRAVDLLSEPNGSLQAKIILEEALLSAEELYLSYPEDSTAEA